MPVFRASSISSNEIDPIKRPAPSAITTAMSFTLGVATYATSAPTSSAEAPTAPQKKASIMAEHRTVDYRNAAERRSPTLRSLQGDDVLSREVLRRRRSCELSHRFVAPDPTPEA